MPANPETRDNSITSESGFASETSKLIRTQSCLFAGRWEMLQAMQLEVKIARKGMGGQGSVMSVLMGSLNDILGNVEKNLLVPFQVGFSAGPHWDLLPCPCLLLLLLGRACTPPCEHIGVLRTLVPTASSRLQVCIPHPTRPSTCFTGAKETPSHLFCQLPLLSPLVVSTIAPAANEFTHTHLEYLQGGSGS